MKGGMRRAALRVGSGALPHATLELAFSGLGASIPPGPSSRLEAIGRRSTSIVDLEGGDWLLVRNNLQNPHCNLSAQHC
jgi:hypothetical protein